MSNEYGWISDMHGSLYLAVSGYFRSIGYDVNDSSADNYIRITAAETNPSGINARTIAISTSPTFDFSDYTGIGASGLGYSLSVDFDVYTNQDRDVEVILYDLAKFSNRNIAYYDWGIAVTGGLAAGTTLKRMFFEDISFQRIRDEELEPNEYLNHTGRSRMTVTVDTNSLL